MNRGWMDLSPADGRKALPRTLALARAHGLYVQVVALAGTGSPEFSSDSVPATSRCATSRRRARRPTTASSSWPTSRTTPRKPRSTTSRGCAGCSAKCLPTCRSPGAPLGTTDRTRWPAARYVVAHVARRGNRWDRVSRVQELGDLSQRTAKFVVDSEPIGAAESPQPSRRDSEPGAFFAQGLLARIFDVGTTFHCEDCLLAACLGRCNNSAPRHSIAGATLASPATALTPVAVGAPSAPVTRLAPLGPQARTFAAVLAVRRRRPRAGRVRAAAAVMAARLAANCACVAVGRPACMACRKEIGVGRPATDALCGRGPCCDDETRLVDAALNEPPRVFCRSLALALATLGASARPADAAETPRDRLARVLGLEGAEIAWLNDLYCSEQQRALLSALTAAGRHRAKPGRPRCYRVIGRRERLFQYVGYRPLPNRLTACDGLIRE